MPTLLSLKEATNLNNLSEAVLSMIHSVDVFYVLDIIVLFIIAFSFRKIYIKTSRNVLLFLVVFCISAGLLLYIPIQGKFFGKKDNKAIFSQLDPNITSYNLSPIGYHILDAFSYFENCQSIKLTGFQKKSIDDWYKGKVEKLPDNNYKGLFKGKNLVVIQVESLEKFVINHEISGQEITPNLNQLLKNSLFFSDVHEQVNQGTTADAEFMANTSIYPLSQGSVYFRYPYNTYNSLPVIFQKAGYSTLAIHPDKGTYWNWMANMTSFGYKKCIDSTGFVHDEAIGMGLSDGSLFRQVEPKLLKQKQPFLTFMITLTSHAPFNLPQKYRSLNLSNELNESTLGGYFQSIHYMDQQIGSFIVKLKKDGLLDKTVIVIYGDHEGVHKYYQSDINKINNTEKWWLDNNKQTPLLIYEEHTLGKEIKTLGGEIDILPTIAYLMGINENSYSKTAMGRNLLKTNKNFEITKSGAYIGTKTSLNQKAHDVRGLQIAQLIIRSNYFKNIK